MKKCLLALVALGIIFALVAPSATAFAAVDPAAYDATISYTTCLAPNGSFYKAYTLEFGEGVATVADADGNTAVKANIKAAYDALKAEVKSMLGKLDMEVSIDDNGDITILEYYEDGYTEMYLEYGYTGYDYHASDSEVERGFLFTTYVDTDETLFADKYNSTTFGWMLVRLASIASLEVASDSILRQYVMSTKYRKTYTTDADYVEDDEYNGIVSYYFYVTPDNINRTYTIKNRSTNLAVWYVMALAIAGAIAIVTVVATRKKSKEEIIYG